jgi:hypothetical protein
MLRALALLVGCGIVGTAGGCCCLHQKLWAIHAGLCGCDGCGGCDGYSACGPGSDCCCRHGCGEYYTGDHGYGHRCDPCDCYGNYVGPVVTTLPAARPHAAARSRPAVPPSGSRTHGVRSPSPREPMPPVPTTGYPDANARPPRHTHGV